MSSGTSTLVNKSGRVGIAMMGTGRMDYIHLTNALEEVQIKLLYAYDGWRKTIFFDDFGIEALPASQYEVALKIQLLKM